MPTSLSSANARSRTRARRSEDQSGRYLGSLTGFRYRSGSRRRSRNANNGRLTRSAQIAAADAPVVSRSRSAGAIIIGKTNLHEFAFGTTSDETAFGAVRNPVDVTADGRARAAGQP